MISPPDTGRILAFGDVNVDLVVEIPDNIKEPPEPVLISGGTVGNTAAGMARLGLDVYFLGMVGGDSYGSFIREEFNNERVNTSFLYTDENDFTLMVIAFIDSHGERHNIAWPPTGTAQFNIHPSDFPESIWDNTGWFHTSGIILGENPARETTLYMMREARKRHIPVSFDLNLRLEYFGWRPGVKEAVLEAVSQSDYVFSSIKNELYPLTGTKSLSKAFNHIMHDGMVLIARQGKNDTIVYTEKTVKSYRPFSVDVVDTLGAGDAFNSGFIFGIISGLDMENTIRIAHGCACFNISNKGARCLPTLEELQNIIQKY